MRAGRGSRLLKPARPVELIRIEAVRRLLAKPSCFCFDNLAGLGPDGGRDGERLLMRRQAEIAAKKCYRNRRAERAVQSCWL